MIIAETLYRDLPDLFCDKDITELYSFLTHVDASLHGPQIFNACGLNILAGTGYLSGRPSRSLIRYDEDIRYDEEMRAGYFSWGARSLFRYDEETTKELWRIDYKPRHYGRISDVTFYGDIDLLQRDWVILKLYDHIWSNYVRRDLCF